VPHTTNIPRAANIGASALSIAPVNFWQAKHCLAAVLWLEDRRMATSAKLSPRIFIGLSVYQVARLLPEALGSYGQLLLICFD
jgi:hypothetical protein